MYIFHLFFELTDIYICVCVYIYIYIYIYILCMLTSFSSLSTLAWLR